MYKRVRWNGKIWSLRNIQFDILDAALLREKQIVVLCLLSIDINSQNTINILGMAYNKNM